MTALPGLVREGVRALARGIDVYLFLFGMMLLSDTARSAGVFDWIAGHAVNLARGSASRLFLLVFGTGVVVTAFMSNDATAVVLTPAVFAAARRARVDPLPYLLACAMVANAASFVLPISNPANLVLYGGEVPPLMSWLARLALPALLSIITTFVVLRCNQRRRLAGKFEPVLPGAPLTAAGRVAFAAIGVTAVVLMVTSTLGHALGAPTAALAVLTLLAVASAGLVRPWRVLRHISWFVIPLVAVLFVVFDVLGHVGVIRLASEALRHGSAASVTATAAAAGGVIALLGNVTNNLPAGLLASMAMAQAHAPARVVDAMLIGVDLGPNLSISGSLATLLWVAAIRREGASVGFAQFLRVGIVVMPPALVLALVARLMIP